ncbi:MAG: hypothetical protein JWM68_1724 [Verrucomicrobiales bacterium]|nr:hypothetical protein [Verrucomicrobiales bacterium]
MRFINLQKIYVPSEWKDEVKLLRNELRTMSASDRTAAWADDKYKLWPLMKKLLGGFSFNKCWYSEEFITGAIGEVDHFRPKGTLLAVAPTHGGYWWAALDCSNFRFSCQICNRLYTDELTGEVMGKGSYFPLSLNGFRARQETDAFKKEKNLLLDPTCKGDSNLLWFDESGEAVPRKSENKDKFAYQRAKESIVRYHLNDKHLLTRRGEICDQIKRDCEKLKKYEIKLASGDADARRTVLELKIQLAEKIQPYAPFSAAAIAMLKGYQSSQAVQEILFGKSKKKHSKSTRKTVIKKKKK